MTPASSFDMEDESFEVVKVPETKQAAESKEVKIVDTFSDSTRAKTNLNSSSISNEEISSTLSANAILNKSINTQVKAKCEILLDDILTVALRQDDMKSNASESNGSASVTSPEKSKVEESFVEVIINEEEASPGSNSYLNEAGETQEEEQEVCDDEIVKNKSFEFNENVESAIKCKLNYEGESNFDLEDLDKIKDCAQTDVKPVELSIEIVSFLMKQFRCGENISKELTDDLTDQIKNKILQYFLGSSTESNNNETTSLTFQSLTEAVKSRLCEILKLTELCESCKDQVRSQSTLIVESAKLKSEEVLSRVLLSLQKKESNNSLWQQIEKQAQNAVASMVSKLLDENVSNSMERTNKLEKERMSLKTIANQLNVVFERPKIIDKSNLYYVIPLDKSRSQNDLNYNEHLDGVEMTPFRSVSSESVFTLAYELDKSKKDEKLPEKPKIEHGSQKKVNFSQELSQEVFLESYEDNQKTSKKVNFSQELSQEVFLESYEDNQKTSSDSDLDCEYEDAESPSEVENKQSVSEYHTAALNSEEEKNQNRFEFKVVNDAAQQESLLTEEEQCLVEEELEVLEKRRSRTNSESSAEEANEVSNETLESSETDEKAEEKIRYSETELPREKYDASLKSQSLTVPEPEGKRRKGHLVHQESTFGDMYDPEQDRSVLFSRTGQLKLTFYFIIVF